MTFTRRLLLSALLGFGVGFILRRPGIGILVGTLIGLMVPVERYLLNPLTYLFAGSLAFAVYNPAFFGVLLLLFLAPVLLSFNLFKPGRNRDSRWDVFDLLDGDSPNKVMMGLLAGFVRASPAPEDEQFRLVKQFIRQTTLGFSRETLWEEFQQRFETEVETEQLAEQLESRTNLEQQKYFLRILVSLGQVDGSLADAEKTYIRTVAEHLDVSSAVVDEILEMNQQRQRRRQRHRRRGRNNRNRRPTGTGTTIHEAYRTLGVDPSASKKDVKKAYQEKVKQHHPDQYTNEDESKAERAEQKMAEINEAYQTIKNRW